MGARTSPGASRCRMYMRVRACVCAAGGDARQQCCHDELRRRQVPCVLRAVDGARRARGAPSQEPVACGHCGYQPAAAVNTGGGDAAPLPLGTHCSWAVLCSARRRTRFAALASPRTRPAAPFMRNPCVHHQEHLPILLRLCVRVPHIALKYIAAHPWPPAPGTHPHATGRQTGRPLGSGEDHEASDRACVGM